MTETAGALDGVRILDLTRLLPGPIASLVLADLGATVDKLEDPHGGDYARISGPPIAGQSALFHTLNRGKRSIILDLKQPAGAEAFRRLVPHYDVLFEQFRPGVLERLGVGHEVLSAIHPRLIICALTGYGRKGPLRARAGHDLNYLARAGLLGVQGPANGLPQLPGFQLADVSGGLWSVIAILAALRKRERTGKGSVLDIAMLDSVVPFAAPTLARLLGGEALDRGAEMLTGGIAPYNVYASKDGHAMTLAALEPKFLKRFCDGNALDADLSMLAAGEHQAALKETFAEVFRRRTRAEWEAWNAEHDCCIEPVLSPAELREDAQIRARAIFAEHDAGDDTIVEFRTPVTPRERAIQPGPRAGQHTDEILREAGFQDQEIATFRGAAVVA
jgi:crotonobetainyl-CoA:carnitine CoA-transferase CaiB-like acyl-CoA transferase